MAAPAASAPRCPTCGNGLFHCGLAGWPHWCGACNWRGTPPPALDPERDVTIWSRWPDGPWLVERSYPLRYLRDVYGHELGRAWADDRGREYRLFERGTNPNEEVA
jgi:hypothetical protein